MKTISIINNKGGVGKTTITLNFGYELTNIFKKKVLLIDLDGQSHLSMSLTDMSFDKSVVDVLLGRCSINKAILKTEYDNLDILPTTQVLYDIPKVLIENVNTKELLRNALSEIKNDYDFCIIDNAPASDLNTQIALVASDEVIVPMNIDAYGVWGLNQITKDIQEAREINPALYFLGCLLNKYKNRETGIAFKKEMNELEQYPIFKTCIRRSDKMEDTTFERIPVAQYSSRSAGSVDFRKFTREYIEGKMYT